jgi:hypothetical protein
LKDDKPRLVVEAAATFASYVASIGIFNHNDLSDDLKFVRPLSTVTLTVRNNDLSDDLKFVRPLSTVTLTVRNNDLSDDLKFVRPLSTVTLTVRNNDLSDDLKFVRARTAAEHSNLTDRNRRQQIIKPYSVSNILNWRK